MKKRSKWLFAAAAAVAVVITAFLYTQSRAQGPSARHDVAQQADRIRLAATREDISNTIEIKGKSSYVNESWVYAPFAAAVKSWSVKDGMQVRKGDVLFALDDAEIKSGIALKMASLRKQRLDLKLSGMRAKLAEQRATEGAGAEGGSSAGGEAFGGSVAAAFDSYADKQQKEAEAELAELQLELDEQELKTNEAKLAQAAFKAPQSGIFLFEDTKEPQRVDTDKPIGKVVDTSKLQLISTVGEYDVFRIKQGMDVSVQVDALKQTRLRGKVEQVSKFAKSGTDPAQFEVVVSLESNPNLIAGLSLVGTIQTDSKKGVVVVPTLAVMRDQDESYIYVERGGQVEKQPITVGLETAEKTEVQSGVQEGDTIILQ